MYERDDCMNDWPSNMYERDDWMNQQPTPLIIMIVGFDSLGRLTVP